MSSSYGPIGGVSSRGSRIPRGRLLGLDVLRALAILGMVWMHFSVSSWLPETGAIVPSTELTLLDRVNEVVGIRPRDIFFVLAGVTVAISTGGLTRYRGRKLLCSWRKIVIRATVLFFLSLLLGSLGAGAVEILRFYAFWLILLLPLTVFGARGLLWSAATLAVACPAIKIVLDNASLFQPTVKDMVLLEQISGFGILIHPEGWGPYLQNIVFGSGSTSQDTIAILPFLVLGLALGRMDLTSHVTRLRLIGGGGAVSAIALLVGMISPTILDSAHAFDAAQAHSRVPWQSLLSTANPGPANPLFSAVDCFLVAGLVAALLGALLILMQRPPFTRALWPIAAFGSMSLTWYCLHLLVIGKATPLGFITTGSVLSYVLFILAAFILSVLWRRFFTRGPLEWIQHIAVTAVTTPRRAL